MGTERIRHGLLPRGLYGRALLILILPVAALQIVVSVVFIQRLYADVTEQMSRPAAREIGLLLDRVNAAPDARSAFAGTRDLRARLRFDVALPASGPRRDRRGFWDFSGRVVIPVLKGKLDAVRAVDLVSVDGEVRLRLATRHGDMRVAFDRDRVSASNPHQLLAWMLFTGLLMTLIATLFLRNQLRPIRRLARAAEAFGKGRAQPFRPTGAVEVRAAGNAFLDMRGRIERQIEQRTQMLSGVSHDLRTPLTRLRLGLSMQDEADPEVAAMLADVADMERMLDAFLDFARSGALEEPGPADPIALARGVVEKAERSGAAVRFGHAAGSGEVALRPMAVTRALENLVENALRHGSHAELGVEVTPRAVRFTVADDGPGIPADRREEALKPFARLDSARGRASGGVGLGLAIATDTARSHGGQLRLGESAALGGLEVALVLPR